MTDAAPAPDLAVSAARSGFLWSRSIDHLSVSAFLALAIALTAAASAWPSVFAAWMQEDAWAEWATFLFFVVAALLNFWIAWCAVRRHELGSVRWRITLGAAALGAFAFFVAGEEISWAQRLFAFQPPEYFLENNYQQELNLHNILKGEELAGISLDSRWLVVFVALGYGLVLPVLALVRYKGEALIPHSIVPPAWVLPGFLAVAAVEVFYPVSLSGEAAELALGMVFSIDALARLKQLGWLPSGRRRVQLSAAVLLVPVVLGMVIPPALEPVLYGSAVELSQQTMSELQLLASDVSRRANEGGLSFQRRRRVHKRFFTAVRDGYVRFENSSEYLEGKVSPAEPSDAPRRDRRGFFLDPWNNPYWVFYVRSAHTLVLYSFGPNRRRDTNVHTAAFRPTGDDLAVALTITAPR